MRSLDDLQQEMRTAYRDGAPGMLVSAVVWLVAGWSFPAMLLVIGSRYLAFPALFGHRIYWACGAALIAAGYLGGSAQLRPATVAFAGSGIEAAFAAIMLLRSGRAAA